jgi:spermidine/putrescine transport system substrate-binding protein
MQADGHKITLRHISNGAGVPKMDGRRILNRVPLVFMAILTSGILLVTGCADSPSITSITTPPQPAEELTIYNWDGGLPQAILDAFTTEYGVAINYQTFVNYEEAVANIESGNVYDVVMLDSTYIAELLRSGRLTELNPSNVPNLRNISVNFRDLIYDPGNRHSIPYSWGTTGLVVRSDLLGKPVSSWSDLWAGEIGKVGIWHDPRSMISLTLRQLGYSVNSHNPVELEAALERLLELKPRAVFLEQFDPWTSAPVLDSGQITIALGWAYDALAGQELNSAIDFIIPQEGTLLWLETMVIPANSPNQYTAELFIDFMLRPEIAGQFVNEMYYAVANDPAEEFIDPAILNNPIVYPTNDVLANAELLLPLSDEAQQLYDEIWKRFMDAPIRMQ